MADDPTLHLIAELDANCAVMGAYYCGECLQCRASNEIRRLRTIISNFIKAEQDMNHSSTDYFASDYQDDMVEALEVWKDAFQALEQEALRD